jgi:hypothetical protein
VAHNFAIITNRKRAVIALAHSVVFLMIAMHGVASATTVNAIWSNGSSRTSSTVMLAIYLIVTTILIQLTRISRCTRERLYFGFCSMSASLGLLRTVFGDPSLHASQYLRVLMLLCAVATGVGILRRHSRTPLAIFLCELCG